MDKHCNKYDVEGGFSHSNKFDDLIGVISNKIIWNPEHTGMLLEIFYDDSKEYAYSQELECWSKDKTEIEAYLNSKNFNL